MIDHFKEEEILKKKQIKNLINLHRKLVTAVSHIKLSILRVSLSLDYDPKDLRVGVTIFNSDNENRSFTFYTFIKQKEIDLMYKTVLDLIKKDDFSAVVKYSGY